LKNFYNRVNHFFATAQKIESSTAALQVAMMAFYFILFYKLKKTYKIEGE